MGSLELTARPTSRKDLFTRSLLRCIAGDTEKLPAAEKGFAKYERKNMNETLKVVLTANLVPFILIGNILVICFVAKFKKLQSPPNYFVVSLAIADILLALSLPFSTIAFPFNSDDAYLCFAPNHILITACGASLLMLAVIAYDRYAALATPLEYRTVMTTKKTLLLISSVWLYSITVSWTPFIIGWHQGLETFHNSPTPFRKDLCILLLVAVFMPACFIIFFCYFKIYCVARHHAQAIAALEMSVQHNIHVHFIKKDTKYTKTIAFIIGTFLLLWLPFQVCLLLENVVGIFVSNTLHCSLAYLAFLNSSLNPWVYAYKNSKFRDVFSQLYRRFCFSCCCRAEGKEDGDDYQSSVTSVNNDMPNCVCILPLNQTNCGLEDEHLLHIFHRKHELFTKRECTLCQMLGLPSSNAPMAIEHLLNRYLQCHEENDPDVVYSAYQTIIP